MYHALLTNRYLTSRVIPLIAVAAVALCVALVIVVVSIMTGFLDMVRSSGRTLMGDVVIACPVNGIPYYERLIVRLDQMPEAVAATPVAESWGLLKMPYPDGPQKQTETVQIWGIEPFSFAKVTGYAQTLHWKELPKDQWERLFGDVLALHWKEVRDSLNTDQRFNLIMKALMLDAPPGHEPPDEARVRQRVAVMTDEDWRPVFLRLTTEPDLVRSLVSEAQWQALLQHDRRLLDSKQVLEDGLTLTRDGRPGIALGMHVSQGNERQHDGSYAIAHRGHWWMPAFDVTLTTLPIEAGSVGSEPESRILPVANEFSSGVYLIDDKRVMAPLDVVQKLLHLQGGERVDEEDPTKVIGIEPARVTMVLVRAKDGVTPEQLRDAVEAAYEEFQREVAADATAVAFPPSPGLGLSIKTWVQQQAEFIQPVEKEREMMRTLFSLVYIVCAGLVLAIFWAIVYEKTRDIGILRSVGASRIGISWIFVRYGLVVGVLGAIVGLGLGAVIVNRINNIHQALSQPPLALPIVVLAMALIALVITVVKVFSGNLLPVVLGGLITITLLILGMLALWLYLIGGFIMWDPAVYYFSRIPNEMDLQSAVGTMIGAVVFSLIGAFVPAAKAADTDPVAALRYE